MGLYNILKKMEEYLKIPSGVVFEEPFINHLMDDFNVSGYNVENKGRLVVVKKKGSKSSKIITAHIDRHGLVFNSDRKFEYAAFNAKKHYGELNEASEAIFEKSGQRFVGESVYAYDSKGIKLDEGIVKGFNYDFEKKNLFFEIDGLKHLPVRTPIGYSSTLIKKQGLISSQIDNVLSVAVARQLVADGFDGTLLLSTEEEIGRSWKHILNYLSRLDYKSKKIITLDTTPYNNSDKMKNGLVVLRNKDENGIFNEQLVTELKFLCDDEEIPYECKDETIERTNALLRDGLEPKSLGKTELGRIVQYSFKKFNGATIQIPTTKYHTNNETTSELAIKNYYAILKRLL